ncbi:hypothetical protein [Prevotella sp.]|uniref:hypothetical protein n=1 Tax=Prevotella sp. TaxID=59823 RepID=UPI0025CE1284|nr:hypothetical protein [Prevotella sp.]
MNKYFLYAASVLALASCSSDDFLGENSGNGQNASSAINFGGDAGKITRATSNTGDYVKMLDGQFKIYGVKKMSETQFVTVFKDYSVWNAAANTTTSNTNGWEYVGAKGATNLGTGNISLDKDQTIKFWDYSASEYRFVAGSPISAFTYDVPVTNESKEIKTATITGLAGHINANESGTPLTTYPVYIADPKIIQKADYNNTVEFSFKRQQAMVRVGLYETIPGYSITEINFYKAGGSKAEAVNNIILTSGTENYFVGGSDVKGTITYDWTGATPSYTYTYTDETSLIKSQNWYAGKFEPHNALATTVSTATVAALYGKDNDMSTNGYFTVIPTPSATTAAPILIKCDYTLTSDDYSGETIKVTGATAAIPAAFSKWEANTRYTYLFKISQNTNGYTGDDPNKAGLYPITFDAAVKESTDAMHGTVTTVSTPSITTYQKSSVTNASVEYKTGEAIYATATDKDGKEYTLKTDGTVGNVQVYKLSKERNEAELQVLAIVNAEIKDENKTQTIVPSTETTVGNVTLAANKYLSFTPDAAGFYAIHYLVQAAAADGSTPAVYAYKVVEVKAATK